MSNLKKKNPEALPRTCATSRSVQQAEMVTGGRAAGVSEVGQTWGVHPHLPNSVSSQARLPASRVPAMCGWSRTGATVGLLLCLGQPGTAAAAEVGVAAPTPPTSDPPLKVDKPPVNSFPCVMLN